MKQHQEQKPKNVFKVKLNGIREVKKRDQQQQYGYNNNN